METLFSKGFGYIAGCWPLDPSKSTLVFIHGAGGASTFWHAQVEGLSERANTVSLDLPGHGKSKEDGKSKIEDYAADVLEFIDAIDVPAPILCGISLGGAIAQQLLFDYPKRFQAGVLISTGAKLRVAPMIFEAIEKDYPSFVEMVCKFACSQKTDPKAVQPFREDLIQCKPHVILGDFRACDAFDMTDRMSAIEASLLIITAEDDQLTPPKYGAFLEKSIRNASRFHISGAGHIVPMEKPEEVNSAIVAFLDHRGM